MKKIVNKLVDLVTELTAEVRGENDRMIHMTNKALRLQTQVRLLTLQNESLLEELNELIRE